MFFRAPSAQTSESKEIKQPEIIFIIGGPGSGKGTQCELLQKTKGYCHISSGDLIRKILTASKDEKEDAEIQKIRKAVQEGALLDDLMIINLIRKEMAKYPDAPGFLIDGCPRTVEQISLFEKEIRPCNKVLYFETTEKVMRERILSRAKIEGREDDNEATVTNRIKVYNEKTLPVVQYFEKQRAAIFKRIDASASVDDVEKQIRVALADDTITRVNFLEFLQLYLSTKNFYSAVDTLEKRHGATNFEVALPWVTLFYIIKNRQYVEKVLSAKTSLGYQYNNFNVAHGHDLNIIATQAFTGNSSGETNPIWKNIHSCLAQSVGDRTLVDSLIKKHIYKLFAKPEFALDKTFEDFMLDFWCEYIFGNKIDPQEYRKTREKLLAATHYAYYDSKLKTIPYIGNTACRFYGYLQGDKFKEIDLELTKYIHQSDSGLLTRFKQHLQQSATFPKDKIDKAVLDNAFDFVLVFDFIHNAMYETLVGILKSELDKTDDRKKIYTNGLRNAFLFPYRSRVTQDTVKLGSTTIAKGMPIYLNMLESGFPHSHGPRSCIGGGVSNWIRDAILQHLENKQLRIVNVSYPRDREKLSHSLDVPVSPERYQVRWQFSRNYLQTVLPHYPFKGVEHFYDVLKAYEKPELFGYMVSNFIDKIQQLKIDPSELCIATPEVRGVPVAAAVANTLSVPLVVIRKPGKIPGPVLSREYSTAYSKDTLEISTESELRKNVVLIDDGIASGGTTLACSDLLEKSGVNVREIMAMINHCYAQKDKAMEKYQMETLFDFEEKPTRSAAYN